MTGTQLAAADEHGPVAVEHAGRRVAAVPGANLALHTQQMLTDGIIKILASIGVALHLGAPVFGWWIGSMRWPVAAVVALSGLVTLGLMMAERPNLEWSTLALAGIQMLALGGGLWWLLSPGPPAPMLAWAGYALGLLWLAALMAFMLTFKLDRLW